MTFDQAMQETVNVYGKALTTCVLAARQLKTDALAVAQHMDRQDVREALAVAEPPQREMVYALERLLGHLALVSSVLDTVEPNAAACGMKLIKPGQEQAPDTEAN